jgi:hypothetical protein
MARPDYLKFKICSTCKNILHISKFNKNKKCKYGVSSRCKECDRKYYKKYYENNKEKIIGINKEYYKDNKEEILEYHKEYYEDNKEEIYKKTRQYAIDNKEKSNEYKRKYKKNNPDKTFNSSIKRRLNEKTQGNGITKEQWYEMMEFFDWKCAYSGEYIGGDNDNRTIDHIVPLNNSGEHEIWNCVPMYQPYNSGKRDRNMLEWYLKQEYFSIEKLTKIYEWRIYAYNKWGDINGK